MIFACVPVNESPSSDHLIIFEFSSSLSILRMPSVLMCEDEAK